MARMLAPFSFSGRRPYCGAIAGNRIVADEELTIANQDATEAVPSLKAQEILIAFRAAGLLEQATDEWLHEKIAVIIDESSSMGPSGTPP